MRSWTKDSILSLTSRSRPKFDGGVYGPKRDSEYSAGGEPPDTILKVLDNPDAPNILMPADALHLADYPSGELLQGGVWMMLLREQILGKERFRLGVSQIYTRLGVQASDRLRTFSARWTARGEKTWIGSGAAGTCTTGVLTWR